MSQDLNNNNARLICTFLHKYLDTKLSELHIPKLRTELDELEEEKEYFYKAMKLLIPITELRESDIDIIPFEHRRLWQDLRTLAEIVQEISNPENALNVSNEKKVLKSIYHDLYKGIESKINTKKQEIQKFASEENIVEELERTILIADKIAENREIDADDYKQIVSIINEEYLDASLSREEEYQVMLALGNYMLDEHQLINFNSMPSDEDIISDIEENAQLLTDEQLRELFARYGYNYDLVSRDYKERLRRLGKLDNIQEIFDIISANHFVIDLDNINRLAKVTIYSNAKIVSSIAGFIKEDTSEPEKFNYMFNIYLASPQLFISGIQRETKDGQPIEEPIKYEREQGCYNNLKAIRVFLKNHNVDVDRIVETCSTLFSTKSSTLEDTYAKLKSYDLSDQLIFEKPSSLKNKDIYEKLDGLIELGIEEYYKKFLARASTLTPEMFLRIYLSQSLGYEIFSKGSIAVGFDGRIWDKNNTQLYDRLEKIVNNNNTSSEYVKVDASNAGEYIGLATHFDTDELREIENQYNKQVEDSIYEPKTELEKNPYIQYLDDNYIESGNVYNIDGVIISRRKVLRLFGELIKTYNYKNNRDLMIYVLTYKTLLTSEQLTAVTKVVEDMMKIGVELN